METREVTREELLDEFLKLRQENTKLLAELDEVTSKLNTLQANCELEREKREVVYKDGIIYGLKYAIRANGVSGGDING